MSDPNRLLIVDTVGQNSLSDRLTGEGFSVEVAGDGQAAVEKISASHYDLVLLDQMVTGASALDLLRLLRATYSPSELPVIVLTPHGHTQTMVAALDQGANDYIVTPAEMPVVLARIKAQLSRSKSERQVKLSDGLTGLGNRLLLSAGIDAALARSPHLPPAVLLLDLDGFKIVNDSFGHRIGDQLLVEVAERLCRVANSYGGPASATVTRIGGDEFGILLEGLESEAPARDLAGAILATLGRPFSANGVRVTISASIGISIARESGASSETLLREADLAMYRAKDLGKNRWHLFDPALSERVRNRLAIAMDLHHAAERGELVAVYQPEIDLMRREIVGFEALLRWQHPERGLLRPSEFIPVAEETGQIVPVGEWILGAACRQLKTWQNRFSEWRPLCMNVNISVKQLLDPNLVDCVAQLLAETGIAPKTLQLELTESSLMTEIAQASSVLAALQRMHVGLKLDDFGTGYSSLSYLRGMRFDSLKIDRSFINRIGPDPEAVPLVESIVNLAHTLRMTVVAEGIETELQLAELTRVGCETGQGFYFAPALEADAAERMLEYEYCVG